MTKIVDPVRFSDHFGIDPRQLAAAGVLDPSLNADTGLFIDPLLMVGSQHDEVCVGALATYEAHFTTVIRLLRAAKAPGDVPWRNALRHMSFPEFRGTCLGYGGQSVSGSGSGNDMTGRLIETAKTIVDLGVDDPDLFVAMALFEEGFGPDRISDMTTNIILGDLLRFNERILAGLAVPCEMTTTQLRNGRTYEAALPVNPYVKGGAPIVLVPTDILRDLPIATDGSEVAEVASKNEEIRMRLNGQIAELWTRKTWQDKGKVRAWALSGKDAFETLLETVRAVRPESYDLAGDPRGEIFWRRIAATLADQEPFPMQVPPRLDMAGVVSVVAQIIEQFRFLIEDRRLSEELFHGGKPRPEKAAQRLFFAVAYAYCKANNLDLTPEAETGNGPVDFKVSVGFAARVLVEIKLSTNGKLVKGYTRQLEKYKTAEETLRGYYVVLDVGQMGEKGESLIAIRNAATSRGEAISEIFFVDGQRRTSASKL
ncbi:hypothetical protein HNP73_003487 [Amaricoccus macauensis]|uniref:Uncharacterized protein n=1 Tax=Amaricoccus macauensis TaxID=57001 RepID=A0A840SS00_9RHOB|nr:hypothetical protein [Amaricoccus macauensis]MBB5223540.1 hypothetical protein [Amaricoccus macauensis]